MGINHKGKSLKFVFFQYLVSVGGGLLLALGLAVLSFFLFSVSSFVLPADYMEKQILESKTVLSQSDPFESSVLPDNTKFLLLSEDGQVMDSDMDQALKEKALQFHNREVYSTASSAFMEIKRIDGYLIVQYSLEPQYVNSWMERYFPKLNTVFGILLIVFSFTSIVFITFVWAKRLSKQLVPMLIASEEIAKQNLDFEIGSSNIKEFNHVLCSMDEMKAALGNSLKENWVQEENRRNQISALTHDLKTPISIVQGNAELLKNTPLTSEQKMYVDYILKNASRISEYAQTLTLVGQSDRWEDGLLQEISIEDVTASIQEAAREIADTNSLTIKESIQVEHRIMNVDLKLLERAVLNVIRNAIEHSKKMPLLELKLETDSYYFYIEIKDNGIGFTKEDLAHATELFYQGDKSRKSQKNHGIGLYSAKKIMEFHHGEILLKNRENGQGAIVVMKLPLSNK